MPEGPAGDPVQADGDIVAALPVEIETVPDALELVMPADDVTTSPPRIEKDI